MLVAFENLGAMHLHLEVVHEIFFFVWTKV